MPYDIETESIVIWHACEKPEGENTIGLKHRPAAGDPKPCGKEGPEEKECWYTYNKKSNEGEKRTSKIGN